MNTVAMGILVDGQHEQVLCVIMHVTGCTACTAC